MRTLNLGILAHVDAGKTTLTERLLYSAGAIDHVGSVDAGTTQTDSLDLERERGITIRSAVASFVVGDLAVNIVDTPGHPDFIAEVERVLGVLDGAVLVVSAVEGVQPQTPLLMRALRRMGVPTLIFVNKIDRAGADVGRVARGDVAPALDRRGRDGHGPRRGHSQRGLHPRDRNRSRPSIPAGRGSRRAGRRRAQRVRPGRVGALGSPPHGAPRGADPSGARPPRLLRFGGERCRCRCPDAGHRGAAAVGRRRSGRGRVGSCLQDRADGVGRTGRARPTVLRHAPTTPARPGGRRRSRPSRPSISVFAPTGAPRRSFVSAGEMARIWGLGAVRVGDAIGDPREDPTEHHFPLPTLESVVVARRPEQSGSLRAALAQLAEQDPLINVRQDDSRHEISVSLYGDVQKEVIQATLERDYGIGADFRETTTLCIERPARTGEADDVIRAKTKTNITGRSSPLSTNPFPATIGYRIEPAPPGSGIAFGDRRRRPARAALHLSDDRRHGGPDGAVRPRDPRGGPPGLAGHGLPRDDDGYRLHVARSTSAADFRRLTQLVLMAALERAGTWVCEPLANLALELPSGDRTRASWPCWGGSVGASGASSRRAGCRRSMPSCRSPASATCSISCRDSRAAKACSRRGSAATSRCRERRRDEPGRRRTRSTATSSSWSSPAAAERASDLAAGVS